MSSSQCCMADKVGFGFLDLAGGYNCCRMWSFWTSGVLLVCLSWLLSAMNASSLGVRSIVTFRKNLWNWLPHLQELKMSELSLTTFSLLIFICCMIVILSIILILHHSVLADFIQMIRYPCWRIDGLMIVFILACILTLLSYISYSAS